MKRIIQFTRAQLTRNNRNKTTKTNKMSAFTNGQLAILDSLTAQGYPEEVIEAQQRLYEALNSTLTVEEEEDILELMKQHEEDMKPITDKTAEPKRGCGTKRSRGAPKGPRKAPEPECRCMARVYGTGNEQCKSRRHKDHGDYCATHGKQAQITEVPLQFHDVETEEAKTMTTAKLQMGLFLGRIDQPRPQVDEQGRICVIYQNDEIATPTQDDPLTFLKTNWHPFCKEGRKAASLAKRWQTKQEKEGAKELKAAERAEKKAEKAAKKAADDAKPKTKKTNPYFLWLNTSGVRDCITTALAQQPGRLTVVKAAEVTRMAGLMWGSLDPASKTQWMAKAAEKASQPQEEPIHLEVTEVTET